MQWPYKHLRHGTCEPKCVLYGKCHCGCGDDTKISYKANTRDSKVAGRPYIFIHHHFKRSQWRVKRPAKCHPDRETHTKGLCSRCYWQKMKRAYKEPKAVSVWERRRYVRFLQLVFGGMTTADALWQLERDVPSEMEEEMAQ